jgi:glycosyltransferase involved in cell wall biosynthesis
VLTALGINWPIGLPSGWGVFGLNLAQEMARKGVAPVLIAVNPVLEINPLQERLLRPHLDGYRANAAALAANAGRPLAVPVLQPLADRLEMVERVRRHPGTPDIGVAFFEHTDIPAANIERARRMAAVLAGSSWNAAVLRDQGLDNVVFCPQGVDLSLFHPAPRRGLFPGRFVVFSGGKFEYRKGQDIVVAAFRAFRQRHPEALLVCSWANLWAETMADMAASPHVRGLPAPGEGGRLDLAPWLADNGIPAEAVIDLGLLRHAALAPVLRECDLAVFPNRCEGGTNLVAMEAMACGVPVVLSANTGHLDLLGPAVHSLERQGPVGGAGREDWGESEVGELLEAMERAHADRAAAARRGAEGAQVMAGWSWDAQVDRLLTMAAKAVTGSVAAEGRQDERRWAHRLHVSGQLAAARRSYERLLAAEPDLTPVRSDLAALMNRQGDTAAAEAQYRRVLETTPDADLALMNLARLLSAQGPDGVEEAVGLLRRALALRPADADRHWRLAWALMLLGRFAEAWPHFDRRHEALGLRQPHDKPRWDGRPVTGFRLLVLDEQGAGDTIQAARYLPLIPRGEGGRVIFAGKPSVLPLLRDVPGLEGTYDWTGTLPPSEMWAPLWSLPGLLGLRAPEQVPPPGDWLTVEAERREAWRAAVRGGLPSSGTADRVVGLCWRGNADFPDDDIRSPGLAPLLPLLDIPGIRFVSLQVGPGRAEPAALGVADRIADIGGMIETAGANYRDTAAAVRACDLVISSCTSVVHVAGTLGVETWLMLSSRPDWRWMLSRTDSPWYPSMTLFRQDTRGDWDGLVRRMAERLAA